MVRPPTDISDLVTALMPALSRSLAEEFNVFRVMHHGTHEKQLSNVFSWLLAADTTHELGDVFQRIFLARVNAALPAAHQLPATGYRVVQEVDTRGDEEVADGEVGMDIADIMLLRQDAAVAVENYGTSDGHGHDYHRYLAHAVASGRIGVVVLLCHRHEEHRQRNGWEEAVVVTYAELLQDLQAHVARDSSWRGQNLDQHFFINQLIHFFVEGPAAVDLEDQVSFLKVMCETGESARYGYRPQDRATQEFADLVAEHARRQFLDGRKTLASVKAGLRAFARTTLAKQVNEALESEPVERVVTRFVGKWEWCVELDRGDAVPAIYIVFGPTAVAENEQVVPQISEPDFSRVFVSLAGMDGQGPTKIVQAGVGLSEVINGLAGDDSRLRDAVLAVVSGTGGSRAFSD